ncbi:MAG TPA: 50S ribosomal protein L4 [Gemmatimonadales bacterium]|jgi:large subunit ribosomal protein L4|nr:50S ribosomal protein L4 [Gemmatimonadales bacterium]
MINAPHYSATGSKHTGAFALPGDLFDGTVNEAVLHQAVKTYLANQRQGTAMTKTRAFVSGGNQKPWKQKGTGRARQGSSRAPHWRGGGVAFGPIPRSYRHELPRKVRQLARRSAFNARAREGMVHVVDTLTMDAPKTRTVINLIEKLSLGAVKTLFLTAGSKPAVYLSCRNVPHLEVLPFSDASAYDILHADALVIESDAFGAADAMTAGDETPAPARKPRAAKAPARKTASKAAKVTTVKKAASKAKPAAKRKKESK